MKTLRETVQRFCVLTCSTNRSWHLRSTVDGFPQQETRTRRAGVTTYLRVWGVA
jgi:hypothetical protein